MTVKNIKVTEFNLIKELNNKNNKEVQNLLKFISKEDALNIMPKKSKMTVSFTLENTHVSLANGIRRCLVDEIETLSFDFDETKSLDTDDKYLLCDIVKKQIELIPINQEYDYSDVSISLSKKNDKETIIDVTTNDIIIKKNNDIIDTATIINNIVLFNLRPGKYINIKNIFISKGTALQNAGKYSLLSNVTYKILDVQPLKEDVVNISGKSSMVSNPRKFYISYTTHRNIDHPLNVMVKCCNTLILKLEAILNDMKNISNSDKVYQSSLITLTTESNVRKISFLNEYWTIINLISQYVYLEANNIKFISASLIHPEKEIGVINIVHNEFCSVIKNSIKNIITDLNKIKKEFVK